jgi:hypothetical protein
MKLLIQSANFAIEKYFHETCSPQISIILTSGPPHQALLGASRQ